MERPHLIAEVAGRPPDPKERIKQEVSLAHWDRFIELTGEQMEKDRAFVKDPKNSYLEIRREFEQRELSNLFK